MPRATTIRISILAVPLALATPVLAHPGHGPATLLAGLTHPFTGADHVLAMVAVGLWAALRGGKAVWVWPLAFVAAMLAGFALAGAGIALPMVEPTILASVIVLGGLVAAGARAPTAAGVVLVALFGLAHGYAHGVEGGGTAAFPFGFIVSTAALHLAGLGIGVGLARLNKSGLLRMLGLGVAAGGALLAFAG